MLARLSNPGQILFLKEDLILEKRLHLSLVLNETGSGLPVSSVEAPVSGPGQTNRTLANTCTTAGLRWLGETTGQFHVDGREEICNPRLTKVKSNPNRQQQKSTDVSATTGVGGIFFRHGVHNLTG